MIFFFFSRSYSEIFEMKLFDMVDVFLDMKFSTVLGMIRIICSQSVTPDDICVSFTASFPKLKKKDLLICFHIINKSLSMPAFALIKILL